MMEISDTTLERITIDSPFDVVKVSSSERNATTGLELQLPLTPLLTMTNAGTLGHVCILLDSFKTFCMVLSSCSMDERMKICHALNNASHFASSFLQDFETVVSK